MNKTISLLANLSKKELKSLSRFLRSPFFNYAESVYQLFALLRKAHPTFELARIRKEVMHQKLFPKEAFKEKKINDLLSDLSLLIEKFLIVQHTLENDYQRSRAKAEVFGKRNLHPLFSNEVRKLRKQINASPHIDAAYYRELLRVNELFYLHPQIPSFVSNLPHPKETMKQVDHYFLINKLKYSCELINRQNILNEQHEIHLLEESLRLSKHYQSDDTPLLQLYARLVQLFLQEPNDQAFEELRNFYWSKVSDIPDLEGRSILSYLVNYTNQQINAGAERYKTKQFELYKQGLSQGLLLSQQYLSDASFINILVLASGLGHFAWADSFIENHKQLLHQPTRENAVAMGKGFVLFNSKKYEDTLAILQEVSFVTDNYKLGSRSLLLRTAYELSLQDNSYLFFTENQVDSFLRFITDNKQFSPKKSEAYLNYGKLIGNLVRYQLKKQKDPKLKIKLLDTLSLDRPVIAKKWLEDKVNQME